MIMQLGKVIGKRFSNVIIITEYMIISISVENYTKYRNLMMKTLDENVKTKQIKNYKEC